MIEIKVDPATATIATNNVRQLALWIFYGKQVFKCDGDKSGFHLVVTVFGPAVLWVKHYSSP